MGVYNRINIEITCPKCHKPLEWQSKHLIYDGLFLGNLMQDITLNERMDGEIYAFCYNCEIWFDADIVKGGITDIKQSKPITKEK